jgi:hypothetical protein
MPTLTSCTLALGPQSFPDDNPASNQMNSIEIQNLPDGQYNWSVSCTDGVTTETSAIRSIVIDTQAPSLVIVAPGNGTVKNITLDIIPADSQDAVLACTIVWSPRTGPANGTNETLAQPLVSSATHHIATYTPIISGSTTPPTPGNGTLRITCQDDAGNSIAQQRDLLLRPDYGLSLQMEQGEYGVGGSPRMTISTIDGAHVTIDVCPDQPGFVQCTSAIITSSDYPQTIALPVLNKTGRYLVDGFANFLGSSKANRTNYTVFNSMTPSITASESPGINNTFTLTASVAGGAAPYRFQWTLHNGTIINDQSTVRINHLVPGNYTQQLLATDSANNTQRANHSYTVAPRIGLAIAALDNQTGQPIVGATISVTSTRTGAERTTTTGNDGIGYVDVDEGNQRIFFSHKDYRYLIQEYTTTPVSGSANYVTQQVTARLQRDQDLPLVTILNPVAGAHYPAFDAAGNQKPVQFIFSASYATSLTCSLYHGQDTWFTTNGTMAVTDAGQREFSLLLAPGNHRARIECIGLTGKAGASPIVEFTVDPVGTAQAGDPAAVTAFTPSDEEGQLQDVIAALENAIATVEGLDPENREALVLVGYDKTLRNTKRAVQQAVRDMNDLQFRKDLSEDAKAAERERILTSVQAVIAATPQSVTVKDRAQYSRYVKEQDMPGVTKELAGLGGFTADAKRLGEFLLLQQQKFTVTTTLYNLEYAYTGGTKKSYTALSHSLTYAPNLSKAYAIYEVIPKEIASSAKELTLITQGEVLKDDPILRFPATDTITYLIPKQLSQDKAQGIKTVIGAPVDEESMITGYAIFGGAESFGLGSLPWWFIVLVGIIILAYIVYYFDLAKQVSFFAYRFGKNTKGHYVSVMINDIRDHLDANNYEKAEMLYREVRMSYDALGTPAKNDLYDDIMDVVHRMDAYYFNIVMLELDSNLKANMLDEAIASYEKLTKVYERLDPERQQQLIAAVTGIARRIGIAQQPDPALAAAIPGVHA